MSDLFNKNLENIIKVPIYDEMKKSYLDYAMSVIVSRALPDVRDGLKPVHRRIVYTMHENGYTYNKPFKKSSRIVGDVMGKYHPHGDSAIYEALVRMAQTFSLRSPLVDGQGNFGSMDGDGAAAMRYTEARMSSIAHMLIDDIDKDTVDFRPNYDDSLQEPVVLPSKFPNLLANGSSGIAVGMATNIPPHNLGELINALLVLIEDEETPIDALLQHIQGPDFPTGAKILGKAGVYKALTTGRGSISICSVYHIEEVSKTRSAIIITEIPWVVNKSKLVEEISYLKDKSDNKELDVISSVRDESDRHGVRVVIELKKDIEPEIVVNYLQKYTPFRVSYGVNMLAIDKGVPKLMNVRDVLVSFLAFRKEVVKRRTAYLLKKAREKAHLLAGLGVAVENIDEVIVLIRSSESPAVARERLMTTPWKAGSVAPFIELLDEPDRKIENGIYYLSEIQARGILDLRLHRLTGLEREKIQGDLKQLEEEIKYYLEILGSYPRLMEIIKEELLAIQTQFATPRKTAIEDAVDELNEEDFIVDEKVAITITRNGYIKRMPITSYRTQRRGGKGKVGINTKDQDFVTDILITNTHANLLFFTSSGLVFKIKCYKIPESLPNSVGRALVNLINIEKSDKITAVLPLPNDTDLEQDIVFATKSGNIRRNKIADFVNIPAKGKIAMKLDEGDSVIGVLLFDEDHDILLNSKYGQCIRFNLGQLRVFSSRNSSGVRAITLNKKDEVINFSRLRHEKIEDLEVREDYLRYASAKRRGDEITSEIKGSLTDEQILDLESKEEFILTITSNGYGKRTSSYEYRITNRGGKGFLGARLSNKNGDIVTSFVTEGNDEIILVSDKGQVIRQKVETIRIIGRVSLGVMLFRLDEKEEVVSVSRIKIDEDTEDLEDDTNKDILKLSSTNETLDL